MAEYVGEPFHPAAKVIFVLVGFVVLLSGVLGNGLLLVVLGRYRPLWQAHNVFIASLALADLIIVCVALPSTFLDIILGYYPVANEAHCRANGFMINAGFHISLMSLVGISFNRYMRVCHTQRFFAWFSLRTNVIICLCAWVLGIIVNIPSAVGGWAPPFQYDTGSHACIGRGDASSKGIVVVAMMVVSFALICFFNCAIFRFWNKSRERLGKKRSNMTPNDASSSSLNIQENEDGTCTTMERQHRTRPETETNEVSVRTEAAETARNRTTDVEKRLVRSLLVVSVVLFVLFFQYVVVIIADSVVGVPAEVVASASLLLAANSAVNWIIYGAMNTSYRQAYAQTLSCCTRCFRSEQ